MNKKNMIEEIYLYVLRIPDAAIANLSIKSLADRFGISRCYLSRAFRSDKKLKLAEFIHAQRLRRAEQMLGSAQNMTVKELAERVGFSDYQYFITCFKQQWGETPARYRKIVSGPRTMERC